ncbi:MULTISPECIES: flagellar basal body rod protein FlgG [Paenibacillus]|uniref:Flagellar hook protein FlgE n=1 Tax=Paenibacillus illinoisensis TaxID=59845 RepID=A0A2W0C442_9BACL|nr:MULTISPECIES: flagellar basal body rod protein FlgG [Paenibacillus]PYY26777.1 Flagellar hook-basal body protein [Paenibacillus illinoisensis]
MLKSMYSGVSGMRGFQTKLDVIGNNIANVNTVGFKGSRVMFKDIMSQTTGGATAPTDANGGVNPRQIGLGVSVGSIDTLHLAGSPTTTNNPTDLRINGDGFFLVKLSEDQEVPYLTRAGDFHVDALRNLVTSDGLFVVDAGGDPITIGEDAVSFTIGQDGIITETLGDGTLNAGAQIGIGKVVNPEGLEKMGGNLYRMTANANEDGELEILTANDGEEGTGAIITGQLEMSNVDLTGEFTEMIVAQRGFQANSRIITTSDEVLQEVVNLKR